ncbi:MAG: MmcQ/YjbR family DNA-binding protein, partial [Chloroflexota bacterium]
PTQPIRKKASQYAGVDEGTACTQSSFKVGKNAFLFIGEQGGRFKAMFKLEASRGEVEKLAEKSPDDFQVGSSPWVTVRFSADKPLATRQWQKWLEESYQLAAGLPAKKSGKKSSDTSKVRKHK